MAASDVHLFRRRFLEEHRAAIENGRFCLADIARLKTDDVWLKTFLQRCDQDCDIALATLVSCLKWRNDFKVQHINKDMLAAALQTGALYIHGYGREGNSILWFHAKLCKRLSDDNDMVTKHLVFWLEQHFAEQNGPLVVLYNMVGANQHDLNLELIKFLFHCFSYYYPEKLSHFLVYEMPLTTTASWKVIRSWLDHKMQRKLKFLSVSNVQDFIDADYLPPFMGGTDDYQFDAADFQRNCHSVSSFPDTCRFSQMKNDFDTTDFIDHNSPKAVKFADVALTDSYCSNSSDNCKPPVASGRKVNGGSQMRSFLSQKLQHIADNRMVTMDRAYFGALLTICPGDEIVFQSVDGFDEYIDVLVLKCPTKSSKPVAFKIKTTSPYKFRVRPCLGFLKPGETMAIKIYLLPDCSSACNKDKFLITYCASGNSAISTNGDLLEFWKSVPRDSIAEYKLRCRLAEQGLVNSGLTSTHSSCEQFCSEFSEIAANLTEENRKIKLYLVCIVIFLFAVLLHTRFSSPSCDCN